MNRSRIRSGALPAWVLAGLAFFPIACQPAGDRYSNQFSLASIKVLLEMPPAPMAWQEYAPYWDSRTPPPDDAAPEMLASWWAGHDPDTRTASPSEKARQRMAEVLLERPDLLPDCLDLLPDTPAVHARVMAIYEREKKRHDELGEVEISSWEYDWRYKAGSKEVESTRRWLVLHTMYFREELLEMVKTSDPDNFDEDAFTAMRSLLKLDSKTGRELLLSMARRQKHCMAMIALMEHSLTPAGKDLAGTKAELREALIRLVEIPTPGSDLRFHALQALAMDRWPGQREWVRKLFADPTMAFGFAVGRCNEPIIGLMADMDYWIPFVSKLLGDGDPAVREAAVKCLMTRVGVCCRPELTSKAAVLALLPWVSDPKWSTDGRRQDLLEALCQVDVPECMPAVIALLKSGSSDDLYRIAHAVAKYKDARAIPLMKEALAKCTRYAEREAVVDALYAMGSYTVEQQVQAITDQFKGDLGPATTATTNPGETPEDIPSEGSLLKQSVLKDSNPSSALAIAVAEFASKGDARTDGVYDALLKSNSPPCHAFLVKMLIEDSDLPALSPDFEIEVASFWGDESIFAEPKPVPSEERAARPAASFIRALLVNVAVFRKDAPVELRRLRDMKGSKGAIGVVMLDDADSAARILRGNDRDAALSLLAAARIAMMKLPLNLVGGLLDGRDDMLADAADAYLQVERSPEAFRIMCAHHRGGCFAIAGGVNEDMLLEVNGKPPRNVIQPGEDGWDQIRIVLPGAKGQPDETWAVEWDQPASSTVIVRRYGNEATITFHGYSIGQLRPVDVTWTRALSADELRDLRDVLDKCHCDELPSFKPPYLICDGQIGSFTHLTRRYGLRVDMDNPGEIPFGAYARIAEYFYRLAPPAPKRTPATAPVALIAGKWPPARTAIAPGFGE